MANKERCVLTVGMFDGVHIGHLAVLKHVVKRAKERGLLSAVLTFTNHPAEVLRPQQQKPLLCSFEERCRLIQMAGIDRVVAVPFTEELSKQTPEAFLKELQERVPFACLILGHDAVLGHQRQGDHARIQQIGKQMGFDVEVLPPILVDGTPVSSTRIRDALARNDKFEALRLLGRP